MAEDYRSLRCSPGEAEIRYWTCESGYIPIYTRADGEWLRMDREKRSREKRGTTIVLPYHLPNNGGILNR